MCVFDMVCHVIFATIVNVHGWYVGGGHLELASCCWQLPQWHTIRLLQTNCQSGKQYQFGGRVDRHAGVCKTRLLPRSYRRARSKDLRQLDASDYLYREE